MIVGLTLATRFAADLLNLQFGDNAACISVSGVKIRSQVGSSPSSKLAGTSSGDLHGQEEGGTLHRYTGVHRGTWRRSNAYKIYDPEGLASLSSLLDCLVCGTLSDSL